MNLRRLSLTSSQASVRELTDSNGESPIPAKPDSRNHRVPSAVRKLLATKQDLGTFMVESVSEGREETLCARTMSLARWRCC